MNNKGSLHAFYDLIEMDHASLFRSIAFLNEQKKKRGLKIDDILMRGFLLHPEEYLSYGDYIELALELNPKAFAGCLLDKRELFRRVPEYMGREWLDLETAADSEIIRFVRRNGKAVMKENSSARAGFRILDHKDSDEEILEAAHAPGIMIAEQYIKQHPAMNAVYPDAVNVMRIHTLRDSDGVRIPLNVVFCFYCSYGSVYNLGGNGCGYWVMLDNDGHCMISTKKKTTDRVPVVCYRHSDTGYTFADLEVPYYREAEKMCLDAALKVPEQRYIGWDVAVTETGPVIVEGNSISGSVTSGQSIAFLLTGHGNGSEWRRMLSDGMEGVKYDLKPGVYFSSELKAESPVEEQFLILLAGWLARSGYRFVKPDDPKINSYLEVREHTLELSIRGNKSIFALPEAIPRDIFAADKLAKRYYEEIKKEQKEQKATCHAAFGD